MAWFILAHSLRAQCAMAGKAWWQECEGSQSHHQEMNAGAELPSSILFKLQLPLPGWQHLQPG